MKIYSILEWWLNLSFTLLAKTQEQIAISKPIFLLPSMIVISVSVIWHSCWSSRIQVNFEISRLPFLSK